MGISSFIKWKPLFNVFFLFLILCAVTDGAGSDEFALLEFKRMASDSSGLLGSWDPRREPNYCLWYGISCDSNSRVLALNITGGSGNSTSFPCSNVVQFPLYGFSGRRECSKNGAKLVGRLSPAISMFTELRLLSLPFNALSGAIPDEIWEMEMLEVLDFEGNLFAASLPHRIGGLGNLRVLNLGFNRISGEIPPAITKLAHLEVLNLAANELNGTFPGFLSGLPELRAVYLSFNQLYGSVPNDIGSNCGKLEHLDLSGNFFMHSVPSALGNCSQLRSLLLYSNLFDGAIPSEISQLEKLEVLDVSRNSLSGSIPPQLGNCSELMVLVLSNLFAPILRTENPNGDSSLVHLNSFEDDYNFFQGSIPVEVTTLPKLKLLWAPRASLDGMLPSNWGACDGLEMVNLAHNFFHGEIPAGLCSCGKLWFLNLSCNRLTGELLDHLPVPCMVLFDVSGNLLSGPIPSFSYNACTLSPSRRYETGSLLAAYISFFMHRTLAQTGTGTPYSLLGGADGIVFLHNFDSNSFTTMSSWPIAPERLGIQIAYSFSAGSNNLTIELPANLFSNCDGISSLLLNVSANRISGQLPDNLGAICSSLWFLDASRNQVTGPIPPIIGDLVHLVSLNLNSNQLQGQIPASLSQLNRLRYLSLADNRLTGSIPSGLGRLSSLKLLELSSNSISGKIPEEIANLRNLTTLLLDHNNLSGQIPLGFANAAHLSLFNASYNHLSGSLPLNANIKCNSVISNPSVGTCRNFPSTPPPVSVPQNYAASPPTHSGNLNGGLTSIEIASIASASAIVAVLLALIVLFLYTRNWKPKSGTSVRSSRKEVTVFSDIGVSLSFENVVRATGSFNTSNCIGNGGFGSTYKAEISPGVLVAIKRLAVGRFHGFQQFHAEIKTLGRLRHPNLVTLLGYHFSDTEMFLIYNYLPGGNLEKFIHERSSKAIDWRILHKIALDIARALAYLHDQCVPRVLHRDVKPSNILLDGDFNAYLSDFGLARLLGTSETHATTGVAGTFGYVAPEYAMTCRVSDKADVYSYGVVLLELLSNKKALDPSFSSYGNGFNIVAWGSMLLGKGRAREFFAMGLWDAGPQDDMVEVLHMAVVCTADLLSSRPTMRQVVRRLKQLQPPSC